LGNRQSVVSVFGFDPNRIGAGEIFARELSLQLGGLGWESVLCFLTPPTPPVREFLTLPNTCIEVIEDSWKLSWRATRRLGAVLRQYTPQILHLHFTGFLGPYPWLGRLNGVGRIFFTDQASRPEGHAPRRSPAWKRLALRIVNAPITAVVCVSGYGYRCFTAMDLLPENRFHLIYNSVDISRAAGGERKGCEFRRNFQIPEERLVITQVSWMIPEKGISDLLDAAQLVLVQEPRAHFVLAGTGEHLEEFIQKAASIGITGAVTFTGVVPDPLADGVYGASDIVCQVSRWEEVFGYVIAEAMASHRPVVGTRVGGIPEIIEDGETGFLVDRGDVAAIADRILRLLRDPDLRKRFGDNAHRAVEEKFDHRRNVAALIDLYGISTTTDAPGRSGRRNRRLAS
jgi:glycosyltransferase involved in cell wall biosynthesis